MSPTPPSSPPPLAAPAGQTFSTTTGAWIDPQAERRGFDFRHFWHSLLEKLWIVGLCVLAGLFLALGYLARTPKLYQGHIVLEVDVQDPTPIRSDDSSNRMRTMFLASQEAMRTIEQNLINRSLLARVIRSEGLSEDGGRALLGQSVIENEPRRAPTATPAPVASPSAAPLFASQMSFTPLEEGLAGALSGMVKPIIRRGTRLIDVYVVNRDPAMAERLAEAVGREYIRYSIEQRAFGSEDTLRYLMEEEERLKKNLQKSEAAVAEYKANTPDALQLGGGAGATGSQAGAGSTGSRGGLVEDKLQELSTKLTTAKSERMRIESELKQIDEIGDNVDALLSVPSIAAAQPVIDRRRDVAQLEAQVAQLEQRYKAKHPKMMAARAALEEARVALKRTAVAQPAVLRNVLEQAQAGERNLTVASREQEKSALALNKAAIGYQELARQAETDRALYESVLRQIKDTNLTKDVKTNAVSVIENSPTPSSPISPKPMKSVMLGLLGGLALGLGFVYATDLLDRSIKTVDQAEATLGLPVLAAIPEIGKTDAVTKLDPTIEPISATYRLVAEAPEGPAAEAFRNLRASLSLLGPEAERKISLFTSALPNEGKSFSSANYALALAQQGHRVLLIDGDLRRPSLHKIFLSTTGEENGADLPGVVDYLVGGVDLATAVRVVSAGRLEAQTSAANSRILAATTGQLSVLTSGQRAPNPAELLSGPTFAKLIADAARQYDRVVIDSAPVLAVSDTLLMTPFVQTVCVVVRASHTPRNAVLRSLGMLTGAGGRPAGIILNRLPRRRGTDYYYYYASPGYGRGEGAYGSNEGKRK
ncbi:MAG: polysaccharide biosynthesis tyrosine autokinase [Chthoniobacterales bacterium]